VDEGDCLTSADRRAALAFLYYAGKLSGRKGRLFAAACSRRVWGLFTDGRCGKAVEAAEQINALLAQRDLARDSHRCPHGRPTSIRFSRHDLERMFKRV
jgi:hypothetical protein